jgi:two-component SAPR family response regulator
MLHFIEEAPLFIKTNYKINMLSFIISCIRYHKVGTPVFFLILFLLPNYSIFGQQYGLRFSGAEVPQYKRTTLDLNPDGFFPVKDELTLSFDLSFPPNLHRYYGYIIRIIDSKDTNIDLVFNYRDYSSAGFTVIHKNEQTEIFLETNLVELFNNWKNIALTYNQDKKEITLAFGDTSLVARDILLDDKIKILFGGNDYKHFKTTDVAPMIIRDIKISEGNRITHHWPLERSSGDSEKDLIRKKSAQIQNPIWIRRLFQNWENVYNETIDGQAAVTYNEKEEKVYLLGQDLMTIYNPLAKTHERLEYKNTPQSALTGRQAFFDTINDRLLLFNLWNTSFSSFDFTSLEWDSIYTGPRNPTLYWHFNKHYIEKDNALLIFGGYGQYEFRNLVHKFSFTTDEYDTLQTTGNTYHPRYLAALGKASDTLYLLGGRGSISGQQIESPSNFYDLTAFSLKNNEFIKLYDFIPPVEDAVFANSMIIDKTENSFYALTFPNYEFYSYLQLIKGDLNEPQFELLGDKIPFQFEDILSYADLYYCKSINKLIAVTLFFDKELDKTNFSVFTISFPPEPFIEEIDENQNFFSSKNIVIIFVFAAALLLLFIVMIIKRKKKPDVRKIVPGETDTEAKELPKKETNTIDNSINDSEEEINYKNTVLFFGGFKIFNNDSVDITNKFSPLLKEIFLLVWLNSMKGYNGVSSEKMKELFWFDKDDKKAMNNRSVNIAKLKSLLEELECCKLSRETGYWKMDFDENVVYNDYYVCLKLTDNKRILQKQDINKLISVINKGAFLEDLNYEWLDSFKADISNIMIDALVDFGLQYDIKQDPDFILNLANTVFKFDLMNEEAMILKCKALIAEGKHSMAKKCYSEFVKSYRTLYDSNFDKSFTEVIK